MVVSKLVKLAALVCSAALTAGCQYSPGMVDRTVAYNEALAESSNQVLLLNIVRASQRYPTYYSRLTGANVTGTLTPQVQMTIPLGDATTITKGPAGLTTQAARAALSMVPQLQATETNQLALQTLDDQKFIRGMMTPMKADLYRYFAETGRTPEMLGLVFISRIELPAGVAQAIRDKTMAACKANKEMRPLCTAIQRDDQKASLTSCTTENGPRVFRNSGDSDRRFCFQTILRALIILGLQTVPKDTSMTVIQTNLPDDLTKQAAFFQTLTASSLVVANRTKGGVAVCKIETGGATFRLARWQHIRTPEAPPPTREAQCLKAVSAQDKAQGEAADSDSNQVTVEIERDPEGKGKAAKETVDVKISIALRSVEGMIHYLGQIARAETQPQKSPPISTIEFDREKPDTSSEIPLFLVKKDDTIGSMVAVEFDGRTYSIPTITICHGTCDPGGTYSFEHPSHRSLDVLSLVNQLWGLQKEESNVPPAPAVTVISP